MISRTRLVLIDVLIWITTVVAIVGIFAVWANRLLLNPDNWANTSTKLLQRPTIRDGTANYLVDRLYANVDVAAVVKSGLPPRLQPLAGPAAGALRNGAVQSASAALSRPRVQTLWAEANRAAAQTLVTIADGGKGAVAVNGGAVTLNLSPLLDEIAARLGLPANVGSKLPPSAANLTVLKSNQLKFVQNAGSALKGLALWLTILVPLLYLLAIALARGHRRRTLMTVGFAIVVAGVLVLLGRSIVKSQVTASLVKDASLRPAVGDVLSISTAMLSEIAGAFVIVGLVVVLAAWFAGPARPMIAVRRAIAPFLREHPDWTFGVTVSVMALIFLWQPIPATGKPAGIIVFSALALFGTAILRRQVATEFPNAESGATMAALRARARERRENSPQHSPSNGSVSEQLERLAALRDRGSITAEEYDSAKAALLGLGHKLPAGGSSSG